MGADTRERTNGSARPDVVVVGAGIIGLAVAWRARRHGLSVIVLERGRAGDGAAHVAAGMLAPVAEVEFGAAGRVQLELGTISAAMWPGFAAELQDASGVELALGGSETLYVARDPDEAAELDRQLEFRRTLGLPVRRLRASEARDREPALAPTIRMALELGGERTVDPRHALRALSGACARAGVDVREQSPVAAVELDRGGRVSGVRLRDGGRLAAAAVVIAAGAWAPDVDLGEQGTARTGARPPVRPVKGQILRLRDPAGPGLLGGVVRFVGGYLVPRGDGRYVLGASVEDRGFDAAPTVGAVHDLLCGARELVPGVDELEIEELSVGFRPGTPDNLPLLGPGAADGLLWAGGHYRNGVLMTPVTAELIAGLLAGTEGRAGAAAMAGYDAGAGAGAIAGAGDDAGASAGGMLDRASRERLLAACSPLRFAVDPGRGVAPVLAGAGS